MITWWVLDDSWCTLYCDFSLSSQCVLLSMLCKWRPWSVAQYFASACWHLISLRTLAYTANAEATQVFGHFGDAGWLHWSGKEQWAVLYAQNFMLIALVWHLTCISATFLHRTFSVIHFIPFKNRVWVGAAVVIVALQFCFCAVSLHSGPYRLDSVPWFVYLLGFAWPIVLVPIQELVKMHDNKEFTRFQKRSKLEFSTKVCQVVCMR